MNRALIHAALGLLASAVARAADPASVAALSPVLAELAREVGGSHVQVYSVVRPGADPHAFNPKPGQVARIARADLVLASGLGIEGYLDRLEAGLGPATRVVRVGERMPLVLKVPGGAEPDPHWWLSLEDMACAVGVVEEELARLQPPNRGAFVRAGEGYLGRLADLRAWTQAKLQAIGGPRRRLVTSHDGLAYFAREWGFTVYAIEGASHEAQADARHMAELAGLIRRESIRSVFPESGSSPRLVEALVGETGVRVGRRLYSDGPGEPGSGAEDYVSMYRSNVEALVEGLADR